MTRPHLIHYPPHHLPEGLQPRSGNVVQRRYSFRHDLDSLVVQAARVKANSDALLAQSVLLRDALTMRQERQECPKNEVASFVALQVRV
jgi:hypothetical protein